MPRRSGSRARPSTSSSWVCSRGPTRCSASRSRRPSSNVPLTADANNALLHRSGRFAPVLELAISYERGDWSAVEDRSRRLALDEHQEPARYREALDWAHRLIDSGG